MRIAGKTVPGSAVWTRVFRRKPSGTTLAEELRSLESQARQACAADGTGYSRGLLAARSGISKETLGAWIDGERVPQDSGSLIKAVAVMSGLPGLPGPDEARWRDLWEAARQQRGQGKTPSAGKGKSKSLRQLIAWTAATVAAVLLTGVFAPISSNGRGILWNWWFPDPAPKPAVEDFKAAAVWCCQFTMVSEKGGFYWKGSPASLDSGLRPAPGSSGGLQMSDLTPAGAGVIEIQLQTSGTEPIYVAPPQVIVHSRGPNVKGGMVAVLPLYPQGSSAPGEFTTDVDDASPVTTANGATGSQYYYVSSGSPELFVLTVKDSDYDCAFDIRLTWRRQGRTQTSLLTNDGRHFRILGDSGLPWYTGDPAINMMLKPASGRPFSYYLSSGT